MLSPARLLVSFLVAFALHVPAPVLAQRPAAPAGYMVYYMGRDGKPLSDGKSYRIAGVYRNAAEAGREFQRLNTYHIYRAFIKDLGTEAEVQAAVRLAQDPRTGLPAGGSGGSSGTGPRPQSGSIANSTWRNANRTFTFRADGAVTTNYGTSGRWTQSGGNVSFSITDGFVFKYSGTVNGNSMQLSSSAYNPRTGNEGAKSRPENYTRQ